jgi:hypothetical protein
MPNTIAHLGVAALATRAVLPKSDIKWIFLGAVLPDVPFILKRIVIWAAPGADVLSIRVFSIIQASLLFCLILAFACSMFSKKPKHVFLVLGFGVVLHLLLDSLQIKWGSEVHLFAPFSWWSPNFGLFWPEQFPSHLMTALGAGYVIYAFAGQMRLDSSDLAWPGARRAMAIATAVALYFFAPLMLINAAEEAGAGNAQIGRQTDRTGFEMEIDRGPFRYEDGQLLVQLFEGTFVFLEGVETELAERGKISAKGQFLQHNRFVASQYHVNNTSFRELSSIVGLAIVLGYWLVFLVVNSSRKPRAES